MGSTAAADEEVSLTVEYIGGIESATVSFQPGVTVLVGRNATNRTSLLKGLMAALGSDWTNVKADAPHGTVTLSINGQTYERTVSGTEEGIVGSGSAPLVDPSTANLFAFLLEDNEARRAVVRGDDLRDIIMRPVDEDELRQKIEDAQRRKDDIDAELDRLSELKQELPELEGRRSELDEQIAQRREQLSTVESRIESTDLAVELRGTDTDELEIRLDELRATREELRNVRDDMQSEQESIAALRDERGHLAAERAGLTETHADRLSDIDAQLQDKRERKRELATYTSRLQNVIAFNEDFVDGEHSQIAEAIRKRPESVGDITEQLYTGSKTTCWTCGSKVKLDRIDSTIDQLREHRQETLDEIDALQSEIEELTQERNDIEATKERRQELDATIEDVDREIARRQSTLTDLRERRENLSERVEELESEVTALRSAEVDELLDHHAEANELEFELDRLESERDEVADEIAEMETEIRRDEELVGRRKAVVEELIDLRTRIDRLESAAATQFNEAIADLLETLGYENIERIWLERKDVPDESVATVATDSVIEGSRFELHIVRRSDGGTVYEDTVDHLSESEREVTGLVFALAGYLVHEVYETVPFMLLDSLEAIDAERIATLVDYFAEYAPYLVVALLPEDARVLPDDYRRLTDIG
jgi:DNA repair exonuclease SbcCD ATPase subunit